MTQLTTKSFLNPYFIEVNNRTYTVRSITLYTPNGVLFKVNKGWFGNGNNTHKTLDLKEETSLRRKENLTRDEVFIIAHGEKDYMTDRPACDLYIPNRIMQFKNKGLKKEGKLRISEVWNSEKYDLIHKVNKKNLDDNYRQYERMFKDCVEKLQLKGASISWEEFGELTSKMSNYKSRYQSELERVELLETQDELEKEIK